MTLKLYFRSNQVWLLTLLLIAWCSNTFAQYQPLREGSYMLQNVSNNQYLTTYNNIFLIQNYNNTYNQSFTIESHTTIDGTYTIQPSIKVGDGTFHISNANYGTAVTLENTESPQGWSLIPVAGKADTYVIKSASTGLTLFFHHNGDPWIRQWGSDGMGDARFQWRLIPIPEETTYKLRNVSTGKYMAIYNSAIAPSTTLVNTSDDIPEAADQKFDFISSETYANQFLISPGHTKGRRFLSVRGDGNSNPNGTQLHLYSRYEPTEYWSFEYRYTNSETGNAVYNIRSASQFSSGQLIGDDMTKVTQWNWGGIEWDTRFQWELVPEEPIEYLEEGTYKVHSSQNDSQIWSIHGARLEPGTELKTWVDVADTDGHVGDAEEQMFEVNIDESTLKYIIKPIYAKDKRLIEIAPHLLNSVEAAQSNPTPSNYTSNQLWDIQFDSQKESYTVRNSHSNWYLYYQIEDYKVKQYPNPIDNRFYWTFERVQDAEYIKDGNYVFVNLFSNKVLDVGWAGRRNGDLLVQAPYWKGDNQKFEVLHWANPNNNGVIYRLRPHHINDVNTNMIVCDCENNDNTVAIANSAGASANQRNFNLTVVDYHESGYPIVNITQSSRPNIYIGVNDETNLYVKQFNRNLASNLPDDTRVQWILIPLSELGGRRLLDSLQGPSLMALAQDLVEPSISVYPNPTTERFSVEIKDFVSTDNLSLIISDAVGNIVYQKEIGQSRSLEFDVRTLGLTQQNYLIHISNGQDKRVSKILKLEDK